jgi:uncharacterized protein (DUF427 family)
MYKALWNGKIIAESSNTVEVEGNQYFPLSDVVDGVLTDSERTSVCHWKGTANYYHVNIDGEVNSDAAWTYREPSEAASQIRDHVAFWHGVEVVSA